MLEMFTPEHHLDSDFKWYFRVGRETGIYRTLLRSSEQLFCVYTRSEEVQKKVLCYTSLNRVMF